MTKPCRLTSAILKGDKEHWWSVLEEFLPEADGLAKYAAVNGGGFQPLSSLRPMLWDLCSESLALSRTTDGPGSVTEVEAIFRLRDYEDIVGSEKGL